MKLYFERTSLDKSYYDEHLAHRLPPSIFDVHVHLNLPEHIAGVPDSRWKSDWALESGHLMPYEDSVACVAELYPNVEYSIAGMPWPIREADMAANNAYLAGLRAETKLWPFMAVRPEWPADAVEKRLVEDNFVGFKPYPDMAIIIAHFGRAFCPVFLEEGLDQLGGPDGFYFDTTAVINPEVYDLAFARIPTDRILYGSDMPILFWHGRREWSERQYRNLCREELSWNADRKSPEQEATYTLFLYEQVRSILDAMDDYSFSEKDKQAVFGGNAKRILGVS